MPRLFAAIRPPLAVMDALIDTMEAVENARWQDEEQLHVTLSFLGEVQERAVGDVVDVLSRIAFAPFDLTIAGTSHFERKGRVHSIWAGIERSEPLMALQKQVDRACRSLGLDIERRKYLPHVTLARFSRPSPDIPAWLARHAKLRCDPFTVDQFALFESHLSSGPAQYEELARFPG